MQREAIEKNIHVTFRRLREVLTARETELIGQLHQTTKGKLKSLAAQSDQIETTLACLHFMRESIKVGNESGPLMMRANTIHQVEELTTQFRADTLKPNTKADMIFSVLTTACENYGKILTIIDTSKFHITDKVSESAVVGVKAVAILHAVVNFGDEIFIELIECELVSEIITGTHINCNVERREQNEYEISYQPTIKGRHQLHIKVGGQHVKESPSNVVVKSPVENLGDPILTIIYAVEGPRGIAINQKGEVVVTEGDLHCVSVFSPKGDKIRSFGTRGSGPGQLRDPRGVAVDGEGNILVADNSNYRIQKFTEEGKFLATVGTGGRGSPLYSRPTDIAFNTSNNKVYVVDYTNDQIQVLNSDLTFSSRFGSQGSGKEQFDGPWGIACDSTGKVYVADLSNHRIQVFTAEGTFVRMFGRRGQDKGQLADPYFISVDTSGMVYVSECDNGRVSVFTSEGQFLTSFGWKGVGPGDFCFQYGIVVDNSGVVYVCDSGNNRIQVF